MKRLLRLVVPCFVLIGLLCAGAIFMARMQPEPEFLPELRRCGNTLCYMGIEAASISWDDGFEILQSEPELEFSDTWSRRGSLQAIKRSPPSYWVEFFTTVSTDVNVLSHMQMGLLDKVVNAGMIVAEFGPPCHVNASGSLGIITVSYLTMSFTVFDKNSVLSPSTPVIIIGIYPAAADSCDGMILYNDKFTRWRGFADYSALMH